MPWLRLEPHSQFYRGRPSRRAAGRTIYWKNAKIDDAIPTTSIPVRLRAALQDGKKSALYAGAELVKDFPFVELDPAELQRRGIHFEAVAASKARWSWAAGLISPDEAL
ncbi:MAG: hypothetical protein U0401_27910 [Anaerolineae bacterium]